MLKLFLQRDGGRVRESAERQSRKSAQPNVNGSTSFALRVCRGNRGKGKSAPREVRSDGRSERGEVPFAFGGEKNSVGHHSNEDFGRGNGCFILVVIAMWDSRIF